MAVANPLDYHTYCWGDREVMEAAYTAMTANGYDMNYLILDFPHASSLRRLGMAHRGRRLRSRAAGRTAHVAPSSSAWRRNIREEYTEDYNARRGIVSFYGIDEALHATDIAADIGCRLAKRACRTDFADGYPRGFRRHPGRSRSQIQAWLISRCRYRRALASIAIETARQLAPELGFPVVLKALGIAHKTEQNAVRLNLQDAQTVAEAAGELFELSDLALSRSDETGRGRVDRRCDARPAPSAWR